MPRTKVRPGIEMRKTLVEFGQASIRFMFGSYQNAIKLSKLDDPENPTKSTGMCYESYRKLVYMARETGLIEIVDYGPEIEGLSMMQRDDAGDLVVVPSTPVFHALTSSGAFLDPPWENIPKFYQTQVMRERGQFPGVPVLDLPAAFNQLVPSRMRRHLEELQVLAESFGWPESPWADMAQEIHNLSVAARRYATNAEDTLQRALLIVRGPDERIEALTDRRDKMFAVAEFLEAQDIEGALVSLEGL